MGEENKLSRDDKLIRKLTSIVHENLDNEAFSVEDLSDRSGISRSQLHRRLKKLQNKSISQFIREIRLDEALIKLQNDVASVSEVAYQVGFSSPTYFNTCFKQYFGYPPGEAKYRSAADKAIDAAKEPVGVATPRKKIPGLAIILLLLLMIVGMGAWYAATNAGPEVQEDLNGLVEEQKVLVDTRSVAVLPLKNWSGNSELEYIGHGITDAVISRLIGINAIDRVIPFASVASFASSNLNPSEIASALNVRYVIEGNFQMSGDQIKIRISMIDGADNSLLWSDDLLAIWNSEEIFEVQAQLVELIASQMEVELQPNELSDIKRIPTHSQEAYNLFLQGRFQDKKSTKKGWENAQAFYKQAIDLDEDFAEAYQALGINYLSGGTLYGNLEQREAYKLGVGYLERGLSSKNLSENLSQQLRWSIAHTKFLFEWDFDGAEQVFGPSEDNLLYEAVTGDHKTALKIAGEKLEEDSSIPFRHTLMAAALYYDGQSESALEILRRNDTIYDDDFLYLRESSKFYYYMKEYEASGRAIEKFQKSFPDRPPVIQWLSSVNLLRKNDQDSVSQIIRDLSGLYEEGASGSPAWFIALIYSHLGDADEMFSWLQRSVDKHEIELIWLREEPSLRQFHKDPRYLDIYRQVGFNVPPPTEPEGISNLQ